MKTYLLDSYNRYKRYSETLDVKTHLCNKNWVVFNDGGERELYKFKEDGTIRIILSGRVSSGTWEYDPSDKSMIITASGQSIMVHPGIYEKLLMGLLVDGTNECAFLIEENNSLKFAPRTKTELIEFFELKEKDRIKEEEKKKEFQLLEEARKKAEELKNKQYEEAFADARNLVFQSTKKYLKMKKNRYWMNFLTVICVFSGQILLANIFSSSHMTWISNSLWGLLLFCFLSICIFLCLGFNNRRDNNYHEWVKREAETVLSSVKMNDTKYDEKLAREICQLIYNI